jgi:hypothetical protein
MLLIKESVDADCLISESSENGVKSLFIEGIYIQGNKVNRNNRNFLLASNNGLKIMNINYSILLNDTHSNEDLDGKIFN